MFKLFLYFGIQTAVAKPSVPETAWPDLKFPGSEQTSPNDAALIVSIEDYAYVTDVRGANTNAADWQTYLTRELGISPGKITWLQDGEATKEKVQAAALSTAQRTRENGKLWLIFIGHGAPSIDGNDGMLVLADAQQDPESLYSRSISQEWLLKTLENGKHGETVAIIDACFSGRTESGNALAEGLQPLIPTADLYSGNTSVLSAGKHDQFAGPLPGSLPFADRPAFTYLTLGGLTGWADVDRDKNISIQEVLIYSNNALEATLIGRAQEPQLVSSEPNMILGTGELTGPDFGEIQRNSKAIIERRQELLAKGLTGERRLKMTPKSKLLYISGGVFAASSASFIMFASNTNGKIQDLDNTANAALDYDSLSQTGSRQMVGVYSFGALSAAAFGTGFYFMF